MTGLIILTVLVLLLTGMGVAFLGSIKLDLARQLKMDEAKIGSLVSLFGFVTIPMFFVTGLMTDTCSKKTIIFVGVLLMMLSFLLFSRVKKYLHAVIAVLMFSAGWATLINVVNVLMALVFRTPEQISAKTGLPFAMNLGNFIFGFGAFVTPIVFAYLLGRRGFERSMRYAGFLVAVLLTFTLFCEFDAPGRLVVEENSALQPVGMGIVDLLGSSNLWLCAAALFFYAPIEASVAAWTTTLLGEKGIGEKQANLGLSGFWLCYMLSRLFAALFVTGALTGMLRGLGWGIPVTAFTILLFSIFLILALSLLIGSNSKRMAMFSIILIGFSVGPLFPMIMATLLESFPEEVHGRAIGLFFGIGNWGWTLLPMCIGACARRKGIQQSFVLVILSALLLGAISLFMM